MRYADGIMMHAKSMQDFLSTCWNCYFLNLRSLACERCEKQGHLFKTFFLLKTFCLDHFCSRLDCAVCLFCFFVSLVILFACFFFTVVLFFVSAFLCCYCFFYYFCCFSIFVFLYFFCLVFLFLSYFLFPSIADRCFSVFLFFCFYVFVSLFFALCFDFFVFCCFVFLYLLPCCSRRWKNNYKGKGETQRKFSLCSSALRPPPMPPSSCFYFVVPRFRF